MEHQEIIDRIDSSWAEFDALIGSVPGDRALEPLSTGAWNLRDVVAHVAFWERFATDRITSAREKMEVDFDQLNKTEYARIAGLTYEQALAELQASHALLTTTVRNHPTVEPDDVACDSWEHYEEHGNDIRAWLTATGQR